MLDLIMQIHRETNSRRLYEATPRGRTQRGARWGQPAPPWCHLAPCGPHYQPASRRFLHRLQGLHLHRSLSRFDPRAHGGCSDLYTYPCSLLLEASLKP
jgi:hypothetical protein